MDVPGRPWGPGGSLTRLEVLSESDLGRIDRATMEILDKTGVAVYDPSTLDLLEKAGARIDRAQSRARIPETLVRAAVEKAPRRFRLGARDLRKSVDLGSGTTFFTNSATGIEVLDPATGERRPSVLQDVAVFARVADALDRIDFFGPTVVARDVPGDLHFLRELVEAAEHTGKHVAHECQGTETTRRFVRIAHVLAGGEEAFARNPVVSAGGCPVSPLQFDGPNTRALVEFARAGVPYDVMSMAMAGGTSPLTLAGTLAVVNAEVLAGIAICELVNPGCPVIYGSVASVMDLRRGTLALGAPERGILSAAAVQLAHRYGVPSIVGGLSTDGKVPGDQAAFEKAMTGLPPILAGSDVVFGPGVLASATTYGVEQLVLDDEIAGALMRIQRGLSVDEETLALDLIGEAGPGGGFLGTRHTARHLRTDVWMPRLADRGIFDTWLAEGAKDMRARARERVREILGRHEVKPLEPEQRKEIDAILGEMSGSP